MRQDHPLYFSPAEKRGIFILLTVCVVMHIVPNVYSSLLHVNPLGADSVAVQQWISSIQITNEEPIKKIPPAPTENLFRFNPNTLEMEGWKRLGVNEKTAQRIRKYIEKGGSFKKPEDLNKIYGISADQVTRLLPYMDIPNRPFVQPHHKQPYTPQKNQPQPLDINLADSAMFESLPGIGPVLARRMVLFREKLGGFYAVEQISQTFGLADSTFRKIEPRLVRGKEPVRKIHLNTATEETLKSHPYIGYKKARALIRYRNEHGPFHSISDLEKVIQFTPSDIQKLQPYLMFE